MFFCLAFKNTGICGVLCILGPKSIGIYSIFCVFAWLPQKTVNAFRKTKNRPKNVSKRRFFPILGTLKTGGGAFCSWRCLWATRIPAKKLSPTLLKDFWCFSGPAVGGSAVWGAPHLRALVALGRSWGKPLVGSRRSRIFGLTPLVGSAGPLGPPFHRSVGVKVTEWGPASEIYSLGFLEHICWNRRFFGEQVSSRKLLRRVFPKELLPISTCYFV